MNSRAFYLTTAALLFTHEVDSAYWKEWDLLGLPGGLNGFLAVHIPLFAYFVRGYHSLAAGKRDGLWASAFLAIGGIAAPVLHFTLLAEGRPEFREPMSIVILIGCGVSAGVQLLFAVRALKEGMKEVVV